MVAVLMVAARAGISPGPRRDHASAANLGAAGRAARRQQPAAGLGGRVGGAVRDSDPFLSQVLGAVDAAVPGQAVSPDEGRARSACSALAGPVIGIGRRSVAVARWIKAMSGGRTKIVRLGNPRADPALFDLVITTAQYPVARAANVLVLPTAMGRYAEPPKPTDEEANWLASLPRPHLLLSLGGPTRYWRFDDAQIAGDGASLEQQSGGSRRNADRRAKPTHARFIAGRDPRSRASTFVADERTALRGAARRCRRAFRDRGQRVDDLRGGADGQAGRAGPGRARRRRRARPWQGRDFRARRATSAVSGPICDRKGLVGSVERPANGTVENPVKTAAAAVRRLLGDGVE